MPAPTPKPLLRSWVTPSNNSQIPSFRGLSSKEPKCIMASFADTGRRCVFVGNIPFGATEEQLLQVCELIGPVVSLRLMRDKTGRPKGFAFCEYRDEETALCALRNLQGHEMCDRRLRVSFADNKEKNPAPPVDHASSSVVQPAGAHGGHDALARYLASASREELTQVLSQMKFLAEHNIELARQLLEHNPSLAHALYQAELMLGMVPQAPQTTPLMHRTPQQSERLVSQAAATLETPSALCAGQKRGLVSVYGCADGQGAETDRPAKIARLNDVTPASPASNVITSDAPSVPLHASAAEPTQHRPGTQETPEFTPEVQALLLNQVAALSPDQLSVLSPEQREQVVQLQQMLRCGESR